MKTLTFKTNIKCGGCLAKVTPVLNEEKAIENWKVDLEAADRVLTVETNKLSGNDVRRLVLRAGFEAHEVS